MKNIILVVLAGIILAVVAFYIYQPPDKPKSFEEAKVLSEKTDKPLLVIFHASWCGPCKDFEATTLKDSKIQARLKNYVVYTSDIEQEPELAKQYLEEGIIPAFVIIKKDKTNKRLTGYQTVNQFFGFLN